MQARDAFPHRTLVELVEYPKKPKSQGGRALELGQVAVGQMANRGQYGVRREIGNPSNATQRMKPHHAMLVTGFRGLEHPDADEIHDFKRQCECPQPLLLLL